MVKRGGKVKRLAFYIFIVFSSFSLSEDFPLEKEIDIYRTREVVSKLPLEKVKALIKIKKNIITDEINFRNRFIELRSLSNKALKENNEAKYRHLIKEIAFLKSERDIMRFYRLQEIENILGTKVPSFYDDETIFDYLNLI